MLFSMLLTLLCVQIVMYVNNQDPIRQTQPVAAYTSITSPQTEARPQFMAPNAVDFVQASQAGIPAVVSIQAFKSSVWVADDNKLISEGSGVLIGPDGYLVTNNHVINNSDYIYVRSYDNRRYKAQKIGVDPSTDIAVLKIDRTGTDYIQFGNSDQCHVGDWVLAIGNPYHLNSTVTSGIISATARNINLLQDPNSVESFIQTDAIVNEGNSGGALVNTDGQLIGLITAIFTKDGRFEGYSFAVPANLVKKVSNDLIKYGSVRRASLGISIEDLNQSNTFAHNEQIKNGVYVSRVNANSAASKAGLVKGDIIMKVGNITISRVAQLQEKIAQFTPGDSIEISLMRDGKQVQKNVILQNLISPDQPVIRSDVGIRDLGFELSDLPFGSPASRKGKGVIVHSVFRNSKVAQSGIEPGFIITGVNGKDVSTVDQLIHLTQNNFFLEFSGYYNEQHQLKSYHLYRKNLFL